MPACFGTGDFARQAYVVIVSASRARRSTSRLDELPLRLRGGKRVHRSARSRSALADLHRAERQLKKKVLRIRFRGPVDLLSPA